MRTRVDKAGLYKKLLGLMLFAVFYVCSASAADAVTLVLVHGKGNGIASVPDVTNNYWTLNMIKTATRNYQAKYLVVSYDGTGFYWDEASRIAGPINAYLNSNPTERLVFVCHSYGGILTRFILCNATSGSPYYNYKGANFARINAATSHAITLATPHKGSGVADIGSTLSNSIFTSWIVSLVDNNSNSAKVLTTSHLASANTTWLRDSLRTKAFYTVAGTAANNHPFSHLTDIGLGAIKLIVPSASDGLVGVSSSHGPGAPGFDWYNTTANHDHIRREEDPGYTGSVIAQYGY